VPLITHYSSLITCPDLPLAVTHMAMDL
jgi:hypothetical protein